MVEDVGTIETGVDELLKLVRKTSKISLGDAAKKLKVDQQVLQTWVDFLVEENILGVEYKFITPYIYVVKHTKQAKELGHKDPLEIKEEFYQKALDRSIPVSRINLLWKQYLSNNIVEIKDQFVNKGKAKGLDERMIEKLWGKYKLYLLKSKET